MSLAIMNFLSIFFDGLGKDEQHVQTDRRKMIIRLIFPILLSSLLCLSACSSTYYAAMEKIGIPKRELAKKRILATQDTQESTKKQFVSALERFRSVIAFDGATLDEKYSTLKRELEHSESQANELHSRVDSVQDVSLALFGEWEAELEQYNSGSLRRSSEEKLRSSKLRYDEMIRAMKRAEEKLEPALQPLRDNVLYLKHNLNAKAVNGLAGELSSVEGRVEGLIHALEVSINESQRFIDTLEQ